MNTASLSTFHSPFIVKHKTLSRNTTPNKKFNLKVVACHSISPNLELTGHPECAPEGNPGIRSRVLSQIARPLACTFFCLALGFSPLRAGRGFVAVAAPIVTEERAESKGKDATFKEHEYSGYTKRLLESVSGLLRRVEEVRSGNGGEKEMGIALTEVKEMKEKLQEEIMSGMYEEVGELKREKEVLISRAEQIVEIAAAALEREESVKAGDKEAERDVMELEDEYGTIWDRVGEIEDRIAMRETAAMSIGVREVCFIERECIEMVERVKREIRLKGRMESQSSNSISKLSRSDIQNELRKAQRNYLEQVILPKVVETEDFGPLVDQDSVDFAFRIKERVEESRKLQGRLEARIRKSMKRFGEEKRYIVHSPSDEITRGFPDIKLKWMFGDKEVVIPKAVRIHLYHGWKSWREEAKANLKKSLLEDVDLGREYVAQQQGRILVDRDRIMSKTWFNEEKNRWEMESIAVPYAVSKKLVDGARIRHDWGAMYVTLKGESKEYFVNIKEFDILFEDFGGFDGLYVKMLEMGIPTAVQLMWIPLSELTFHQQFFLAIRLLHQALTGLWKSKAGSYARDFVIEKVKNINDDIAMTIFFPLVEYLVPYPIRMRLGMAWPEYIDQTVGSTWYLKWQSEAELNFRDPNMRKLRRVKSYFRTKIRRIKSNKKAGIDPISTAFDGMKRVKNPPIPLKEFASIDSMREEINEVVAFLQNPRSFQDMGARAPRGVLIVGERGTGKTSLALAIAAEARVPVVRVEAQQLEAGLWVGQSASNVRELFQTARDLAPVIIFVEDFDLFAGVRGKFIHTKKQDHEAFINQLLVELDGFEKQDGVLLMATTRSLKQIDEALQRPGRMDRVFHLQRPTQAEREKILHMAAKETMDNELIEFVDWHKVAEKTALLRPVELKLVPAALEGSAFRSKFVDADELLSYCSWFATFSHIVPKWVRQSKLSRKISRMLVDHLGLTLTKEDMLSVVDLMEPYGQISNGIELLNPPVDWTKETKFPHAVWAAGRGLIALLLPNFDSVDNLWLEPLSWQGIGCTKITKAHIEDSGTGNSESRSYLEKKLVFCFGSHIAAQILLPFGEENLLSAEELRQAQEIATRMVIQYGWGPDDSPAIYYHTGAVTALSMGNNHEYEMAAKVEEMYNLAFDRASEMLRKNRQSLEKIVEDLLEYEILTGKDLERILEENGGVREREPFSLVNVNDRQPISSGFLEGGNGSGMAFLGTSS
ncbi:hypothetical protein MLD38_038710 [Melastoma candidum]|uniref:Uncharacterized protein n=1 Tax=Melastoma candidum TaxID=119954 RepID=A0ACB9L120_9MYRT|nr:hypothetical protein MLD38_038710 [Melastoma candidum]